MSDSSRDRIEGKTDEVGGKIKSGFGDLTGDEQTQAEGEAQEGQGKLKQGVADAKDKIDDLVKKVTN
ncbi:MAG: CsbD family protein [Chloroflexota bacterium]|nr:CsbD family protein [Chloroflexota bacterium]